MNKDLLEVLEKIEKHLQEISQKPTLNDVDTYIKTNLEAENTQEKRERLIENSYIQIKGEKDNAESEVIEVNIERFKEDIDYREQFRLPKEIDDPGYLQLANYLAKWLFETYDIRAVLLNLETNSYELWCYDRESKIWKKEGMQKLKEIVPKQIPEKYSRRLRKEIVERLQGLDVLKYEEMGVSEGQIAVQNGLLNLNKGKITEIDKEDYAISKLPVKYYGGLEIPEMWKKMLEEWTRDEKSRKTLQEFAGYCLMHGTAKYERGLMLLGPTDSGKTVFLDVMRALLGEDNIAQESLQDLANTRWAAASLKGKMANIDHDLNPKAIKDLGTVKKLTSGNEMMAERKHKSKFKIKPTAKLMFSANRVPDRDYEDEAFYNRWLTVIFPETIPDGKQDSDILDKLTQEEILQGILRWAIAGQKRLEEQGGFTRDLDPLSTRELWNEWGNSVERFLSEYCEKGSDYKIHTSTLYEMYKKFAEKTGMEIESKKGFTQKLSANSGIQNRRVQISEKRRKGFVGITLQDDAAERLSSDEN